MIDFESLWRKTKCVDHSPLVWMNYLINHIQPSGDQVLRVYRFIMETGTYKEMVSVKMEDLDPSGVSDSRFSIVSLSDVSSFPVTVELNDYISLSNPDGRVIRAWQYRLSGDKFFIRGLTINTGKQS